MKCFALLKKFAGLGVLLAALSFTSLHAQTVAYVANASSRSVSVIDTLTNTVISTIPVGVFPAGVAVSPDSRRVYVANFAGGTISVIDTASNTVVATIVLSFGTAPLLSAPVRTASLFSASTALATSASSVIMNAQPALPAITPDGASLYVPDFLNAAVFVIDTATNTVRTAVLPPAATQPVSIAITRDGLLAYVLNLDGTLFVLDTATNTQQGSAIVTPAVSGNLALGIVVAPDGRLLVPGGPLNNAMEVISGGTVSAVPLSNCPSPTALVFTPDGSHIYETCAGNPGAVAVLDANNLPPTGSAAYIPVGSFPDAQPAVDAITPDGGFVYVTNFNDASVSVIDATAAPQTEVSRISVGDNPFGIVIAKLGAPPITSFHVTQMAINSQNIHQQAQFTLSTGIDLIHQPLTLTIGTFSVTVPAGNFKQAGGNLHYVFNGAIDGLKVNFNLLANKGSSTQFSYVVHINGTNQTAQPNPALVTLTIGANTGTTTASR